MEKKNMLMKLIFVFLVTVLIFQSCIKDKSAKLKAEETRILNHYLSRENITISPTKTGLYYIEKLAGTGSSPASTDWVEFNFTGRLVSDTNTVVMTSDSLTARENSIYSSYIIYSPNRFQLNKVFLEGLIEGLGMMKEGGKARLIFPSTLGYGDQTVGLTPAYNSLIVDIELVHVIPNIVKFERDNMNAYLLANNITEDSTSSGLYYHEILEGSGNYPITGNKITFTYKGTFLNGKLFSTSAADESNSFYLGYDQILQGLDEGIRLIKNGGKAKLIIPYYLAYGETGYLFQDDNYNLYILVWPYTTLVYDIEIINIE